MQMASPAPWPQLHDTQGPVPAIPQCQFASVARCGQRRRLSIWAPCGGHGSRTRMTEQQLERLERLEHAHNTHHCQLRRQADTHTHTGMSINTHIHTHTYTHTHRGISIKTYIYIYAYRHSHTYTHIHVYMRMYTHQTPHAVAVCHVRHIYDAAPPYLAPECRRRHSGRLSRARVGSETHSACTARPHAHTRSAEGTRMHQSHIARAVLVKVEDRPGAGAGGREGGPVAVAVGGWGTARGPGPPSAVRRRPRAACGRARTRR
jgi:hypothetical protein